VREARLEAAADGSRPIGAGFFVLRAPTLPIDLLQAALNWDTSGEDTSSDGAAAACDRALQDWIADPWVTTALYLASPTLVDRLADWAAHPTDEAFARIRPALLRYFIRMTSRPTPFGLFASFTTGRVGPSLEVALGPRAALRRSSWLDLGFLYPLVARAVDGPGVRKTLRYVANSTVTRQAEGWRYTQEQIAPDRLQRYLAHVDSNATLEAILESCRRGSTIAELRKVIRRQLAPQQISARQANEYIDELIDSRLLVPTLAPTLTAQDPLRYLIQETEGIAPLAGLHETLNLAARALAAADEAPAEATYDAYRTLARSLNSRSDSIPARHLFHVDLRREGPRPSLPESLLAGILGAVRALHRICAPGWPHAALETFRARFIERYGDREVDLLNALDEEDGIGFEMDPGDRLDEGLLGQFALRPKNPPPPPGDERAARILAALLERIPSGGHVELELTEQNIASLAVTDRLPLPEVFTVVGMLLPPGPGSNEPQAARFALDYLSSGVGLLGRFCRADERLTGEMRALLRREEALHPAALFAEVVHLPQERTGNIVCRPALRSKDLPYLGQSGLDPSDQIPLSDLSMSIEGQRLVLRSRSLNREVLPRITCAHDVPAPNASVYRFLAALADQGVTRNLHFRWSPQLEERDFLPRVRYGPVVLKAASWRIPPDRVRAWSDQGVDERTRAIHEWREQAGAPRWIRAGYGDRLLTLDLASPACAALLIEELRRMPSLRVSELCPQPDEFLVRSPEGRHAHEVMIPFLRPIAAAHPPDPAHPGRTPCRRRFPPGSRWLYLKLYGSARATEELLLTRLAELAERSRLNGSVDLWHFVRYADPEVHLRLRFHGHPRALNGKIRPQLERIVQRQVDRGSIWRCQFDTYEREVIRYGGTAGVEVAEAVFHADSDLAVALLKAAPPGLADDWRWRVCALVIDLYHGGFGLDAAIRHRMARQNALELRKEFRPGKSFEGQLSRRFREERAVLEALLDERSRYLAEWRWIEGPIEAFRTRLEPLAARYLDLASRNRLAGDLRDVVQSLAHMHVVRMLRANPREHEMIIHAFLERIGRARTLNRCAAADRRSADRARGSRRDRSRARPVPLPAPPGR
jgi:thiopeptide-type bacteriocin biosynthesis protein